MSEFAGHVSVLKNDSFITSLHSTLVLESEGSGRLEKKEKINTHFPSFP
jgi:hypothetical protein